MIKLFQTPTSEAKGQWHILADEDDKVAHPLCNAMGYWFGGYHGNKPSMTKESMRRAGFTGAESLCSGCVEQAYRKHLITIQEARDGKE